MSDDPWDAIISGDAPEPVKKASSHDPVPVGNLKVSKTQPKAGAPMPENATIAQFDDPVVESMIELPPVQLPTKMDGVFRSGKRYRAIRKIDGTATHLGTFDTPEEAHSAWEMAQEGEFNKQTFRPSLRQRELVRDLCIRGLPKDRIASHVINPDTNAPINVETLYKHFKFEIGEGLNQGDREVVSALNLHLHGRPPKFWLTADGEYILDKTGKPIVLQQELRPNVAAAIFMSKVRPGVGLREVTVVENVRPVEDEVYEKLKSVPREQLLKVRDALRAAAAEASGEEPAGNR